MVTRYHVGRPSIMFLLATFAFDSCGEADSLARFRQVEHDVDMHVHSGERLEEMVKFLTGAHIEFTRSSRLDFEARKISSTAPTFADKAAFRVQFVIKESDSKGPVSAGLTYFVDAGSDEVIIVVTKETTNTGP